MAPAVLGRPGREAAAEVVPVIRQETENSFRILAISIISFHLFAAEGTYLSVREKSKSRDLRVLIGNDALPFFSFFALSAGQCRRLIVAGGGSQALQFVFCICSHGQFPNSKTMHPHPGSNS
jgi:hypothetical protein